MMGITHVAVGIVAVLLTKQSSPAMVVGILAGSLLPDIDTRSSTIGRIVPVLPRLLKHRTLTHSVWVVVLGWLLWAPLGFGMALHVVADCFTTEGVELFWPAKLSVRVPLIAKIIKAGGWLEGALCGACWGYIVLVAALSLGQWQ